MPILSTMVHNGVIDARTIDNHALLQFNIKHNTVTVNVSVAYHKQSSLFTTLFVMRLNRTYWLRRKYMTFLKLKINENSLYEKI